MQSKQQFKIPATPLWTNWLIKCNIRWETGALDWEPQTPVNANTPRSLIFTQPARL